MRMMLPLLLLVLTACSGKKREQAEVVSSNAGETSADATIGTAAPLDYDALFKLETYLANPENDTSLLQVITESVALMITPTEAQVNALEAEYGEDFYTIADDASYYQAMAGMMIDSLGVNSVNASKPFVQFIGASDTFTLDIRKQGLPEWNVIFFNTKKSPEVIPAIELTEEKIRTYFEL